MSNPVRILIADDEIVGRQLLEAILLPENYSLSFACDGREAIDSALREIPDIILLDVMMPHHDGFEVCKKLKATRTTAHIPVFLITALDDRDSRIRGINAGADDYISKPFDRVEILGKIKNKNFLIHQQQQHTSTGGPSGKGKDSTPADKLAALLLRQILQFPPSSEILSVAHVPPTIRSQHAFIHQKQGDTDYYLLVSNKLGGHEAMLANSLFAEVWKKELVRTAKECVGCLERSLRVMDTLIHSESVDIPGKADFSMVQVRRQKQTNGLIVAGHRQSVIVQHSAGPGGYRLYPLKTGEESGFSGTGNAIMLSPELIEKINDADLLGFLNKDMQDKPGEEIVLQIRNRFPEPEDSLVINLCF